MFLLKNLLIKITVVVIDEVNTDNRGITTIPKLDAFPFWGKSPSPHFVHLLALLPRIFNEIPACKAKKIYSLESFHFCKMPMLKYIC